MKTFSDFAGQFTAKKNKAKYTDRNWLFRKIYFQFALRAYLAMTPEQRKYVWETSTRALKGTL